MEMVIGTVKILPVRAFFGHKTLTEAIMPIFNRHGRWQHLVEIREITSLPGIESTSSVTKATVRWATRKWITITAMIPDEAEQPIALHRSPSRRRWRHKVVRIERWCLAHAHPLVRPLPAGELVGTRVMRPGRWRAPHRRRWWRRRVEVVWVGVRRGRGWRRLEVVGEGMRRERRRRAEG